jgi:hypothetical protein
MVMSWDLEDWLTAAGDQVIHKAAASGSETLTPMEQLIYEIWVFDTETRNGGVSQYFGNRGMARWQNMRAVSECWNMPRLKQFLDKVDLLINEGADPYAVALATSPPIENIYWSYQTGIVDELRSLVLGC